MNRNTQTMQSINRLIDNATTIILRAQRMPQKQALGLMGRAEQMLRFANRAANVLKSRQERVRRKNLARRRLRNAQAARMSRLAPSAPTYDPTQRLLQRRLMALRQP